MNNIVKKSQRWGGRAVVASLAFASVGLAGAGVAGAEPVGSTPTPAPSVSDSPSTGVQATIPVSGQVVVSSGQVSFQMDAAGHHFTGKGFTNNLNDFQSSLTGTIYTDDDTKYFATVTNYSFVITEKDIAIYFRDVNRNQVGYVGATLPDKLSLGTGDGRGNGTWA